MSMVNGMMIAIPLLSLFCLLGTTLRAGEALQKDTVKTSVGDLDITFIGHGSLMMTLGSRVIHIDPYSQAGDYSQLPKADLILLTHDHPDHLDPGALKAIRTGKSRVILTRKCAEKVSGGTVMSNGDALTVESIRIEAVPAYNVVNKRPDGQPFHPRGEGNGYILTFGNTRVYVAGDTENIDEMKGLKDIEIAFLPMNLPYTMTPEMVADAARSFRPKVLYPYHYGETDTSRLVELLKADRDIEVRIRKMR